ncbi:uncharacterized protein LOC115740829 isoform X2 [Rhodamnia argentea]|uniref:Uncharacterized protein LOC115740829 isoform X2 n=1 Tax=Rhodamnia argentea TaxID=178133 RepID=A0A8B8P6B0_9MYRT|nr:uncharacterized protein LOC115740829 isoform X2 [Rhodamnia argentea]
MKGRSQRLQSTDPPDDWVDGSWTVDCICGVNFDDGEEMVNCDECGVWVHTRCSRYVKGEESFACDKCKSKNNRNDSEETEVAQLLVELPTKTMRMEASYAANGPARRPFRLWTEMPLEEKVHVQGIPGGDQGLFSGLSSVFTPQLWKCTGYVPKKFNFQYREFPCWNDHKEADANAEEDNENAVDKGAGVLFSLSKENFMATPVKDLVGMKSRDQDCRYDRKTHLSETKKWGAGDNVMKKERTLLRPVVIHTGKRKKEESGILKDISGKKKARTAEKDVDHKKRTLHTSKADRGPKSFKTDIRSVKNRELRDGVPFEPVSDGHVAVCKILENAKANLATLKQPLEGPSAEFSCPADAVSTKDEAGNHLLSGVNSSLKIVSFSDQHNEAESSTKLKVKESGIINNPDASATGKVSVYPGEDVAQVAPETKDKRSPSDVNSNRPMGFSCNVKKEVDDDSCKGMLQIQSCPLADKNSVLLPSDDARCPGVSNTQTSENFKANDVEVNSSQCTDKKSVATVCDAEAVCESRGHTGQELFGDVSDLKQEAVASDDSIERQKSSAESKAALVSPEEPSKPSGSELPIAPTAQKVVVSFGEASSTPSSLPIQKSSSSDKLKPSDAQNLNPIVKQRTAGESDPTAKEQASADVLTEKSGHDLVWKTAKFCSTSPSGASLKASHSSKVFQASGSRRTVSDSKDHTFPSCKSSSSHNVAVSSGTGESPGTLHNHSAAHPQNKATGSGLPQKSGKSSHTNFPPSSKVNHSTQGVLPNPSTLSDEALAFLLHQELNSSPRVPRVRHAGSLPQLASQAATSIRIKRTSSSGAKDHNLVPRRKGKDGSKDVLRSSSEYDDEVKRTDRVASPDQGRRETVHKGDASKREMNGSMRPFKKNIPALTTSTSSGPSSSNEANDNKVSSTHNTPLNNSDDDTGTVGGLAHRTLPGLINEIMSKGRRMTYEELCNAVLPHWHNLRKHNGERYAYSSHSQAVLDCLRNRQEWAQLIDRGPKTSLSRKRRKIDAEESEDNEDGAHGTKKEVESRSLESQREEFPKGKRNARKRRRLALQGRGVKDLRNRRKTGLVIEDDDDDEETLSNSSEDSIFSEDEIQGGGRGPVGSDASSSSDEIQNM